MSKCVMFRQRSWMVALVGCVLALSCGQARAENFLENVVEPQLEGTPVITGDEKDNPTMYHFTIDTFEIHPFAGAHYGYDSNIYLVNTNRDEDSFFEFAPGLLVRTPDSDTSRWDLKWLTNFDGRFFVNKSNANTIQFDTYLDADVKGKGWNVELTAGGGRFEDPINVTFADRSPRGVGEAKLMGHYDATEKIGLEAGYHYSYIDFHGSQFNTLDRIESEVPVRVLYKWTDTTEFYVKSGWKLVEFKNPGLNDFYLVDSRVGVSKSVIENVLTFDANIGLCVQRVKNDNGRNPRVGDHYMTWDGVLSYTPKEILNFTAAIYCTPRVNLAVTEPVRPVYGGRLDASVKLMEKKLTLSVEGLYERIDNLPTDSDQTFMTGSLRAQYAVRTYAFVYASYMLTAREADGTTLDYVDNKIALGGGIKL